MTSFPVTGSEKVKREKYDGELSIYLCMNSFKQLIYNICAYTQKLFLPQLFLSDLSPIIGYACHSLPNSLTEHPSYIYDWHTEFNMCVRHT